MTSSFANQLSELLSPVHVQGCAANEIEALEANLGLVLPSTLRTFLRLAGETPGLMGHLTISCASIRNARSPFFELFESLPTVPDECSVPIIPLCQDCSDVFYYLIQGSDADDPPLCVLDNDRVCTRRYDSFSQFLLDTVAWYLDDSPGF